MDKEHLRAIIDLLIQAEFGDLELEYRAERLIGIIEDYLDGYEPEDYFEEEEFEEYA